VTVLVGILLLAWAGALVAWAPTISEWSRARSRSGVSFGLDSVLFLRWAGVLLALVAIGTLVAAIR
jgi:hypothetical protein